MDPITQHLDRLVEDVLKPFDGCALAALTVVEDLLTLEVLGFLPLQALLALSQALDCDQIEMQSCAYADDRWIDVYVTRSFAGDFELTGGDGPATMLGCSKQAT